MFFRSDNPDRDFDRWEAHQERRLRHLPKCDYCGEPIQDEHYFEIHEEIICESCLDRHFKVSNQFL